MNAKTLSTIAALLVASTLTIAPSLAQATCTPDQANNASWQSRSTIKYLMANAPFIDETLYLSDAIWDAKLLLPKLPSYLGHLIADPVFGSATNTGGSWLATNDFFIRVDHVENSTLLRKVKEVRAQVGYLDAGCSMHEGVDMTINTSSTGVKTVSGQGLVSVSQGAAPARPAAGTNVQLDGCWEITTDYPNTGLGVYGPFKYQFAPNGTFTGPVDAGAYAAVENSNNEIMFVVMTNNGTLFGGELTDNGFGKLEVDPADGVAFIPYLAGAGSAVVPLPAGYLSGAPDPRQGTFEMHYFGPTC